ncbi:MAG: hypothetical protein JXR07_20500 [Reichenbachiella sp.]
MNIFIDILSGLLKVTNELHLDYYFNYLFFSWLAWANRDKIDKAARGGNGIYQWPEILQLVCLMFFVIYTMRIIFFSVEPNVIVFGALLTGSGIGGFQALANNKIKDKPPKQ